MRRQFLLAALMTAAVAIPAAAQFRRGGPSYGGYSYGYGREGNYGAYGRSMRGNPVRAAMSELDMIFRRARVDSHEADHFRKALRELADFDRNAARGRFDRGSLDSALRNMADLAQARQLHPRDRQVIRARMDDLYRLRNSGMRW